MIFLTFPDVIFSNQCVKVEFKHRCCNSESKHRLKKKSNHFCYILKAANSNAISLDLEKRNFTCSRQTLVNSITTLFTAALPAPSVIKYRFFFSTVHVKKRLYNFVYFIHYLVTVFYVVPAA